VQPTSVNVPGKNSLDTAVLLIFN